MPATAAIRGFRAAASESEISRMYPRKNHIPEVGCWFAAARHPNPAEIAVSTRKNRARIATPP